MSDSPSSLITESLSVTQSLSSLSSPLSYHRMSSSDPSKALLMQHFLKDLTIMLSGMPFHAADTHRATFEGAARLIFPVSVNSRAYRRPTPQPAHEPYGSSLTGFKTTSRNVQRSGLFYRLFAKQIITHKQSSLASLMKEREHCIINLRKSSFLGSSEFLS